MAASDEQPSPRGCDNLVLNAPFDLDGALWHDYAALPDWNDLDQLQMPTEDARHQVSNKRKLSSLFGDCSDSGLQDRELGSSVAKAPRLSATSLFGHIGEQSDAFEEFMRAQEGPSSAPQQNSAATDDPAADLALPTSLVESPTGGLFLPQSAQVSASFPYQDLSNIHNSTTASPPVLESTVPGNLAESTLAAELNPETDFSNPVMAPVSDDDLRKILLEYNGSHDITGNPLLGPATQRLGEGPVAPQGQLDTSGLSVLPTYNPFASDPFAMSMPANTSNTSHLDVRPSTGLSSSSTDESTKKCRAPMIPRSAATGFVPERPKLDPEHAWVRINETTHGKTSRSGKLNQYDAKSVYKPVPHPLGPWKSSRFRFEYNKYNELSEKRYSAKQIQDFIYSHPRTKHCRLKLWIQRAPSDSARRYPTRDGSKCRFRDCPTYFHGAGGTILHGHYRVAFDETYHRHASNVDPFFTAGFVHLYCLERFCDFKEIVQRADVEVDTRQLVNEPNMSFAGTLHQLSEGATAMRFVHLLKNPGSGGDDDASSTTFETEFPDYPAHEPHSMDACAPQKRHIGTLTHAMHVTKHARRTKAQLRCIAKKEGSGSRDAVHLGDLEIYVAARQGMMKERSTVKRKRIEDGEESEFKRTRRSL